MLLNQTGNDSENPRNQIANKNYITETCVFGEPFLSIQQPKAWEGSNCVGLDWEKQDLIPLGIGYLKIGITQVALGAFPD